MRIFVRVKLRAKAEKVEQIDGDHFIVSVHALPIEGRANEAVIRLLADYLDVAKSSMNIVRGFTSREKVVEIL